MAFRDVEQTCYWGADWHRASGPSIEVINPANETVLASVPSATPTEVNAALVAARAAQPRGRASLLWPVASTYGLWQTSSSVIKHCLQD